MPDLKKKKEKRKKKQYNTTFLFAMMHISSRFSLSSYTNATAAALDQLLFHLLLSIPFEIQTKAENPIGCAIIYIF